MTTQTIDKILIANTVGNTVPITFKAIVFADGTVKVEGEACYPSMEEAQKQWAITEPKQSKDDYLFFIEED